MPERLFSFSEFFHCEGEFIDANEGTLTVIATLIIALFTYTLWQSTNELSDFAEKQAADMEKSLSIANKAAIAAKQSAEVARDTHGTMQSTAERDLRAYVSIKIGRIYDFNTDRMSIEFCVTNHGRTPAAKLEMGGAVGVLAYPLPPETPAPDRVGAAGTQMTLYTGEPQIDKLRVEGLSAEDIAALKKWPNMRVYFLGRADYEDVFREPRWTKVCVSFATTKQFLSLETGGSFDPVWEYATQHNEFE